MSPRSPIFCSLMHNEPKVRLSPAKRCLWEALPKVALRQQSGDQLEGKMWSRLGRGSCHPPSYACKIKLMNHLTRRPVSITPGGCAEANYTATQAGTALTNPEMLELFIQRSQQLVPSVRRKITLFSCGTSSAYTLFSQSQTWGWK